MSARPIPKKLPSAIAEDREEFRSSIQSGHPIAQERKGVFEAKSTRRFAFFLVFGGFWGKTKNDEVSGLFWPV